MNTLEELAEKAGQIELKGVNFWDANGAYPKDQDDLVTTEFQFIDGTTMSLPRAETDRPDFETISFRLAPTLTN